MRDGANSASLKEHLSKSEHLSNCREDLGWLHFYTVSMVKKRQQVKDQPYKLKLGTIATTSQNETQRTNTRKS